MSRHAGGEVLTFGNEVQIGLGAEGFDDVDLRFYYPDPTNYYIDAMCIPKGCQNQELAEIFINYMLSEEPAVANAEYICYACPNSLVYESEDYI